MVQFILDEARKYFLGQKNKNTKKKKKKPKMNLEEYLMLRDFESGHSAMHRCLFHGPNLTCARVLLRFATEHCSTRSVNLMHQPRCFRGHTPIESLSVMTSATTEEEVEKEKGRRKRRIRRRSDVFAWGSGVNYTLGTGNHKLNTNGVRQMQTNRVFCEAALERDFVELFAISFVCYDERRRGVFMGINRLE